MAEADGIEYVYNDKATNNKSKHIFFIPCEKCGGKIEAKIYIREKHYVCDYCKKNLSKRKRSINKIAIDSYFTKGDQRMASACEEMAMQIPDFDVKYEKCINALQSKKELFDSIPEIMVALELLKLGKDDLRDEAIKYALGHEWQILHVPAEMIRKKIKMLDRIVKKALE